MNFGRIELFYGHMVHDGVLMVASSSLTQDFNRGQHPNKTRSQTIEWKMHIHDYTLILWISVECVWRVRDSVAIVQRPYDTMKYLFMHLHVCFGNGGKAFVVAVVACA